MVSENARRPTLKVIITGASGFIGKNLVLKSPRTWKIVALYNQTKDFPRFIKAHRLKHVIPVKCDLTSIAQVKKMAQQAGRHFDACIYLAANGNPALSIEKPLLDLKMNTDTVVNFLSSLEVRRFIYFSSGAVYDGLNGLVSTSSALSPTLPYAISKLISEQYIKHFHRTGKIGNYIILRFFGAYGPYEPKRKIFTRLINDVILKSSNKFIIRGDGKNLIDAMYIDDAIRGIFKIIHSRHKNLTIDFACGSPLTINELVRRCLKILGKSDVKIRHVGKTSEYIKFFVSHKVMEEEFAFQPEVSLNDGLLILLEDLKRQRYGIG